ncbi:MAG: hypothetical protein Q4A54_04445 [Parabacteroides sp.]|nr:hypothetical protein [Parabacteroides sp.]
MKSATKIDQIILLIQSLSKAEKRYIKLYTNLQNGNKNYMFLYDCICDGLTAKEVYEKFSQEIHEKSLEMAAKHLYQVLLDCLVQLRDKQDIQTTIFNYITKSNILFERELFDNAFAELEKARKLATIYEKDLLILLIHRTELKYLRSINFKGINEKALVNKQMQINDTMKFTRNINQHLQLYDILKHRIIYRGFARSNKQKEGLNDLVLSELNLIANHSYKGFEAQKLHLLFQATYYLNAGNFKSAIRFYKELITLFEANQHLILNPPIYYTSAIEGVLESLHIAGLYHEMPFFISKLKEISQGDYPTEFIVEVQAHIHLYELSGMLNTGQFDKAKFYAVEYNEFLAKKVSIAGPETQLKLYLHAAILHLCLGEISKARKNMKKILGSGKSFYSLPSFKTARLINLVIQAESENYEFFTHEINSIKRMIRYEKQIYITEKLLFRFLMAHPLPVFRKDREKLWSQYQKESKQIREDKYEKQLLKSFDFIAWIESRLTSSSFQEILIRIQNESE